MKATVKDIFNSVSRMNVNTHISSSCGSYSSEMDKGIAEDTINEVRSYVSAGSLAEKIANSNNEHWTDKQLWVITYDLIHNADYCEIVEKFNEKVDEAEKMRRAKKEAKNANARAGKEMIAEMAKKKVKESGKKLADYYSYIKGVKAYAHEYYSKHYTLVSATEFVNQK